MMRAGPSRRVVAILGGGLSGAVVAINIARSSADVDVIVVEPRPDLGRGLAYSATDPDHRLNVPDTKMTVRTDVLDDYARWLRREGAPEIPEDAIASDGAVFTSRWLFGDYVSAQITPDLASGRIRHERSAATGVEFQGGQVLVSLAGTRLLVADALVLALTHPKPHLPPALQPVRSDPRFIADPLAPGALEGIGPNDRIAIIGSGLTSADILSTLARNDVRGKITCVSRHGWRSKPHAPKQGETSADFASHPAATVRELVARAREAVTVDSKHGLTWHAVFDRLRSQGPQVWAALPEQEKRRFLRHLRSLWDVHRFRVAPQTYAVQERLIDNGQLTYLAGSILGLSDRDPLTLAIKPRGSQSKASLSVDRIILATGPSHATVTESNPALASLLHGGAIESDGLGLGIRTSRMGRAITERNGESDSVFVAGPLARGTVGELMGVPEVVGWSEHVAASVLQTLAPSTGRRHAAE